MLMTYQMILTSITTKRLLLMRLGNHVFSPLFTSVHHQVSVSDFRAQGHVVVLLLRDRLN